MVPYLRSRDYDSAITMAVGQVAQTIAADAGVTLTNEPQEQAQPQVRHSGGVLPFLLFILIFLFFGGFTIFRILAVLGLFGGGFRGGPWMGSGWGGGGGGFGGGGGGGGRRIRRVWRRKLWRRRRRGRLVEKRNREPGTGNRDQGPRVQGRLG